MESVVLISELIHYIYIMNDVWYMIQSGYLYRENDPRSYGRIEGEESRMLK